MIEHTKVREVWRKRLGMFRCEYAVTLKGNPFYDEEVYKRKRLLEIELDTLMEQFKGHYYSSNTEDSYSYIIFLFGEVTEIDEAFNEAMTEAKVG